LTIKVQIKGIDELNKTLQKVSKELQPVVRQTILEVSRVEVETKSKYAVPVDTGRLRASIHTMEKGSNFRYTDKNGNSYDGNLKNLRVSENEIAIGTNVNYAKDIHRRGGKNGKGKEFLEVAFNNAIPKYIQRIKQVLP
jgi:phage gpG-like protein